MDAHLAFIGVHMHIEVRVYAYIQKSIDAHMQIDAVHTYMHIEGPV